MHLFRTLSSRFPPEYKHLQSHSFRNQILKRASEAAVTVTEIFPYMVEKEMEITHKNYSIGQWLSYGITQET